MKLLWIFLINGIFGVIVLEIKEAYSMTAALIAGGLFSAAFAAVQQRLKNKNEQSGAQLK
ncbi:hypothetical protein [Bacillus haynesii]|nr:hypothetical protein [Bacillus haynesii]MCY9277114.1 hypothetical protein [Bacillus haynesii]